MHKLIKSISDDLEILPLAALESDNVDDRTKRPVNPHGNAYSSVGLMLMTPQYIHIEGVARLEKGKGLVSKHRRGRRCLLTNPNVALDDDSGSLTGPAIK